MGPSAVYALCCGSSTLPSAPPLGTTHLALKHSAIDHSDPYVALGEGRRSACRGARLGEQTRHDVRGGVEAAALRHHGHGGRQRRLHRTATQELLEHRLQPPV